MNTEERTPRTPSRWQPSASRWPRPQETPNLLTSGSWTSSCQEHEKINASWLRPQPVALRYGRGSRRDRYSVGLNPKLGVILILFPSTPHRRFQPVSRAAPPRSFPRPNPTTPLLPYTTAACPMPTPGQHPEVLGHESDITLQQPLISLRQSPKAVPQPQHGGAPHAHCWMNIVTCTCSAQDLVGEQCCSQTPANETIS